MTISNPNVFDKIFANGTISNLARAEFQKKGSLREELKKEIARLQGEIEEEKKLLVFSPNRQDAEKTENYISFLTCQVSLLQIHLGSLA